MLGEIPGILPERIYDGCTRNAYHLYMFRYKQEAFGGGLARARFLKALSAEGVPCSAGYGQLNLEPFIKNTVNSRPYQALFSKERLARWDEQNNLPQNAQLTTEAVWFTQNMLLGPRSDMEQIAEAIKKIQAHASGLAKS
jgi:dTDP-4-amino-4,6-dideoxygalactose transaminase